MSLRAALGRLWCKLGWLGHLGSVQRDPSGFINWRCHKCGRWSDPFPITPVELPEGFLFNWLRDYGPLWEPGSTAFWLEPETCDELASWVRKYRPDFIGILETAGLRIEMVPAPPPAPYFNQRSNQLSALQNAYGQNAHSLQGQNSLNPLLGGLLGNRY